MVRKLQFSVDKPRLSTLKLYLSHFCEIGMPFMPFVIVITISQRHTAKIERFFRRPNQSNEFISTKVLIKAFTDIFYFFRYSLQHDNLCECSLRGQLLTSSVSKPKFLLRPKDNSFAQFLLIRLLLCKQRENDKMVHFRIFSRVTRDKL